MDADTVAKYSSNLERSSWLLVFFGNNNDNYKIILLNYINHY